MFGGVCLIKKRGNYFTSQKGEGDLKDNLIHKIPR